MNTDTNPNTEMRPSNTVHVVEPGNEYTGIMQKTHNGYYSNIECTGCLVYNPETQEVAMVKDEHMHMKFRCSEFHTISDGHTFGGPK